MGRFSVIWHFAKKLAHVVLAKIYDISKNAKKNKVLFLMLGMGDLLLFHNICFFLCFKELVKYTNFTINKQLSNFVF